MMSAIVVNKENAATGDMEPATLKGFVAAARELGHVVTDDAAFLVAEQQALFEAAENGRIPPSPFGPAADGAADGVRPEG